MDWVQQYIDWFVAQPIERITTEDAREYALIGKVQLKGPSEKKLLCSWLCSLCNAIHKGPYGVTKIVSALDVALLSVDKRIFDGDSESLLRLANDLLSALDPGQTVFTEGTYSTHSATMSALHQTFVAIQETSPDLLDPSLRGGVYQTFKTHLQEIAKSQRFYRFKFLVKMIEQSIQRLEQREKLTTLTLGCSRLFHGMIGVLCILDGIRSFAEIEFKLDAFEAGHRNLRQALRLQCVKRKPWYEWIQALNSAALLATQDPEKFAVFETCYDSLMEEQSGMKKGEDRWTIRFGMIDQLASLTLHAPNDRVRSQTFEKLLDLGKKKEFGGWAEDKAILQPLFDAFRSVYNVATQNQKEDLEAMKIFNPFKKPVLQRIFFGWRRDQSIRKRVAAKNFWQTVDESGRVFRIIRERFELSNMYKEEQEHQDALKAIYQAPAFAKVDPLFDNERPKHISSFNYSLVRYEETMKLPGEIHKEEEVYSVDNYDRKNMVPKPIQLDDLFKDRRLLPDGPNETVQKILLVGNPGTGKTSLAKKLAYLWAEGEWGTELEALYVVQVRELAESFYDGTDIRKAPSVASAIANNLFPWQKDAEYNTLHERINAELENETTLLILDGLDEEAGARKRILEEAKHCSCKLLMLSRPYGLHQERRLVDFEVECLGLSDDQLVDFVKDELPEESSPQLVSFLKTNPSVWTVAHVPVITNIICFLWKERSQDLLKGSVCDSPFKLYTCMAQQIWKRHVEKHDLEDVDGEDVFAALGKIAFDALKEGQILISQTVVGMHLQKRSFGRAVKTSGFLLLQLEGLLYHFAHFTFQEFFAGGHMVKVLNSKNHKQVKEAETFIAYNKYNPRYRVMLSFVAEKIRDIDGVEGFDRLMSIINRPPRDIAGVQHLILSLTVLEAFSSLEFGQAELDELYKSKAFEVVQMTTAVWKISPAGKNLGRVMLEALEAAPRTAGNFKDVADALVEKFFMLPQHIASGQKAKYERILKHAASQLAMIANSAYDSAVTAEDKLVTECEDHSADVRRIAVGKIPGIIQSQSQPADKLVDALIKACGDESEDVREVATKGIPAVINVQPSQANALAEALVGACGDHSANVRLIAIERIPALIESHPRLVNSLEICLDEACGDKSPNDQPVAIKELLVAVESHTSLAAKLATALIKACVDESADVRRLAIQQISSFTMHLPRPQMFLADMVIVDCLDTSPLVRTKAITEIPSMIASRRRYQRDVDDLVDTLIRRCEDENVFVSMAACRRISMILRSAAAHKLSEIVKRLLELSSSCGKEHVEFYAKWSLGQLPIEAVIDQYWESFDPRLISFIAPSFLRFPFFTVSVSSHAEPQFMKLALHCTSSNVIEWERPVKEIEDFIKAVKGEIKCKNSTLLQLTGGETELCSSSQKRFFGLI